ncbi:hypothetical protein [Alphaentomopoxvirus acuprea]|uniref:Uncharacterized protein n=1 Tax=Alphaentomopoxvirus acuprea TaxID=62099 RepID=W6JPK7_9POXV|nr:hypothetical protein BA82_gp089 [Anomala cuprea entomopoxvirus]BAO49449.1 hypothetical protein [Anomala cuprea entomopoxvirus]
MLSNIETEFNTIYNVLKSKSPNGIKFDNMDIKISEDGKTYFSVNYNILDDNLFPKAIPKNIKNAKSMLQKYFNTDTNINVKSISILLSKNNNDILRKWQVIYTIHIDY